MWRAFFIALGISLCILGVECLVLEKAIMKRQENQSTISSNETMFSQNTLAVQNKEIKPKDWHPWSLLSTGAVIILYSFSLPKRNAG